MNPRVIARLDIKGPNLVKGIQLEGLRVLGRPEDFARDYYGAGVDELLYVDAVASLYGRNSLLPIVERTAREIFVPLTVAGGLRTLEDMRAVLAAGADKVALNTAALADPELISRASARFGSSTVVVSIEAKRRGTRFEAFTDNGREPTGVDACDWAERAEKLGAGEILLTSIDREGTGQGLDLELCRAVAARTSIPVVACGGAGGARDVAAALLEGCADAVAIASLLHYERLAREPGGHERFEEGNLDFLTRGGEFSRVAPLGVSTLKRELARSGIRVSLREPLARAHADRPREAATRRTGAGARAGRGLADRRRSGSEVAVVDLGTGNLASVAQACERVGLRPRRVERAAELAAADALFLPGVGAFGHAVHALQARDLAGPLRDAALGGTPLVGICLGLQLLASESLEFGRHAGLDLVQGVVSRLACTGSPEKVPLVGWRALEPVGDWAETPLRHVEPGAEMYFVHSYALRPSDARVALSSTRFGDAGFCSTLLQRNVFACQYHPERSGAMGLALYAGIRDWLEQRPFEGST